MDFILHVSLIEAQTEFAAAPQISCIFTPLDMQVRYEAGRRHNDWVFVAVIKRQHIGEEVSS